MELGEPAWASYWTQTAQMDRRVQERLGVDCRAVWLSPPRENRTRVLSEDSFVDEWGVTYHRGASSYHPAGHPLAGAGLNDLASFPWPDPLDPGRVEGLRERAIHLYEETPYLVVANLAGAPMATAWALRGFDQSLMDLLADQSFAETLLDRILEFQIPLAERVLEEVGPYVQVVTMGDDLGTQDGPMISLEIYRKVIKPRHAQLIAAIKRKTDAKIFFHCCGSARHAIEDLVEIGVDILNPVQVAAAGMDTAQLKRDFGDKITFWGAIDTQWVLPCGTPQDVETEVRRRLDDLAPGGGFVVAAVHNVQAEVPPANIVAMCEAVEKYGRY
jgi:uroporphyrinogen decarboxylase